LVVLSNSATDSSVNSQKSAKFSFSYTDASGDVTPAIVGAFGGKKAASPAAAIAEVKAGKLDAYFDYPENPAKQHTKVYGTDEGIFNNGKYSSVATQILVASAQSKIGSPALSTLVQGNINIDSTTYKDGRQSGGINGVIPPLIFLVLFYVVILLLGNQMLTSTLEEKENRVTEMILTTMNATTLVVGKVLSLFIIPVPVDLGTVGQLAHEAAVDWLHNDRSLEGFAALAAHSAHDREMIAAPAGYPAGQSVQAVLDREKPSCAKL
jgi:ABC-2 type transport system permease protein